MIVVATADFELYHEIVGDLRDRGVAFTTVKPGDLSLRLPLCPQCRQERTDLCLSCILEDELRRVARFVLREICALRRAFDVRLDRHCRDTDVRVRVVMYK